MKIKSMTIPFGGIGWEIDEFEYKLEVDISSITYAFDVRENADLSKLI